jgi:hypothetical protein
LVFIAAWITYLYGPSPINAILAAGSRPITLLVKSFISILLDNTAREGERLRVMVKIKARK